MRAARGADQPRQLYQRYGDAREEYLPADGDRIQPGNRGSGDHFEQPDDPDRHADADCAAKERHQQAFN